MGREAGMLERRRVFRTWRRRFGGRGEVRFEASKGKQYLRRPGSAQFAPQIGEYDLPVRELIVSEVNVFSLEAVDAVGLWAVVH